VRFARGRAVLDTITRMLASKLGTTAWSGPAARGASYWDRRLGLGAAQASAAGAGAVEARGAEAPGALPTEEADPWGLSGALRGPAAAVADGSLLPAFGASPPPAPGAGAATAPAPLIEPKGFFGSLRVLGQVRRMLIVCEGDDALHVIDQHAADERVRYDRLRAAYRERAVATQRLLFPERVECSPSDAALVEEHSDAIAALGLECTLLGPTTIAVHTVPRLVDRASPERLLRDVLDEMAHRGDRAFGDAIDMALATMACHGSIRAGDALSIEECVALLHAMDAVRDFGGHCPHGRPVVFSIGFGDLERRLGR
jgi:DNA mismatch repair protein MutL